MLQTYCEFKDFLLKIKEKPKILLHVCCAPCSSHVLLLLNTYFDITIYFSNDNIFPFEEFNNRLTELKRFIKEVGLNIRIIEDSYEYHRFLDAIRGKETLGERSLRCYNCYYLRMKRCANYAKINGFDYFTTVLSISPYKNSKWINEIGYNLENEIGCTYLYSDYKKEEGYKHSLALSNQYGLYRQNYCGCEFSKREMEVHRK